MSLDDWLNENPPAGIPFYPHARETEPFGLRRYESTIVAGASPGHMARDRSRGDSTQLYMIANGDFEWKRMPNTTLGSLMKMKPYGIEMEVHVFHTAAYPGVDELYDHLDKHTVLPVKAGNLSTLDLRTHTHLEVLLPFAYQLQERFTKNSEPFVLNGQIVPGNVLSHCVRYSIDFDLMMARLSDQVSEWKIEQLWPHFAVREAMWRSPWKTTALVDSKVLLDI